MPEKVEREETEEKESVRKTEKERHEMKYKVGDKVRVIKATSGVWVQKVQLAL